MIARRLRPLLAGALLSVLAGGACAGGSGAADAAPGPAPAPGAPEADPSLAELEALYRARRDSARMRFTEADVRFMSDMIAHHTQALVMADLAEERASDPSVRTLAARIDNAQRDEIATIRRWLGDRDQPLPGVHVEGTRIMMHGGHDHAGMPGMLSDAEMDALEAASGAAFDRLFLESMIRHHRGAVAMVDVLFGTDGAGQDEDAFRLATDIRVDQVTEIARMERMLEALSGEGGERR